MKNVSPSRRPGLLSTVLFPVATFDVSIKNWFFPAVTERPPERGRRADHCASMGARRRPPNRPRYQEVIDEDDVLAHTGTQHGRQWRGKMLFHGGRARRICLLLPTTDTAAKGRSQVSPSLIKKPRFSANVFLSGFSSLFRPPVVLRLP